MAFELAALDPTSVPINLLIPKAGTKFGDREILDPWEAVKWVAIFRLVLPDALFRLCGGRVENLAELQPLAVKAGRQRRDDGQLPDDARQHAGARTARCSRTWASTSPASPTTAPTRARTTAPASSTARRPTSSRSSSTTTRRAATIDLTDPALGSRRRSCASGTREDRPAAARRRAEPLARGAAAGRRPAA